MRLAYDSHKTIITIKTQNTCRFHMGKPDALDRLVQFMIALTALFCLFNGGSMVWDPYAWYQSLLISHRRI